MPREKKGRNKQRHKKNTSLSIFFELSPPDMIQRPALGQLAELGDLYNARTDQLCGLSIFRDTPRLFLTHSLHNASSEISYFTEDPSSTSSSYYHSKFTHSQIHAPQHQLNILVGLTPLNGSASYLVDDPVSSKTVRCVLRLNSLLKTERINYLSNELTNNYIDPVMIEQSGATHMVFQIRWGSILNLVAESKDPSMNQEGLLKFLCSLTATTLSMREQEELARHNSMVNLTAYSDNGSCDQIYWDSAWTMINAIRNVKTVASWTPTVFYLVPIPFLRHLLKLSDDPVPWTEYKPNVELSFLPIFEQILNVKQQLHDLWVTFQEKKKRKVLKKIEQLKKNLERQETKLKIDLQYQLPLVRLGLKFWTCEDLSKLSESYLAHPMSAIKIMRYLKSKEFKEMQDEIEDDNERNDADEEQEEKGTNDEEEVNVEEGGNVDDEKEVENTEDKQEDGDKNESDSEVVKVEAAEEKPTTSGGQKETEKFVCTMDQAAYDLFVREFEMI